MVPLQTFKKRYVILMCLSLLGLYFASLRWYLLNGKRRFYPLNGTFVTGADDLPGRGALSGRTNERTFETPFVDKDAPLPTSISDKHPNCLELSVDIVKGHQNGKVLFFNRVPKTGSELVVLLLQWLQGRNGFRHHRLKNPRRRYLTCEEQVEMAAEIGEKVSRSQERLISFDRHVHFTNFTQVGAQMPLLINIVRDPVEKIASRFYYARVTPRVGGFTPQDYRNPFRPPPPFLTLDECMGAKDAQCSFLEGREYDLTIPYFCGHEKYCRQVNNVAAFLTAKRNAEQWYAAVGVLEALNITLAVFESTLPQFFKGVTRLYFEELNAIHPNKNWQKPNEVKQWIVKELRQNLSLEYEFYSFLKQKLHRDFHRISATNG